MRNAIMVIHAESFFVRLNIKEIHNIIRQSFYIVLDNLHFLVFSMLLDILNDFLPKSGNQNHVEYVSGQKHSKKNGKDLLRALERVE